MTRDDIIRMAREAGSLNEGALFVPDAFVLRFAAIVAAAEREAIIDIVAMYGGSVEIEAAIRARGEKE